MNALPYNGGCEATTPAPLLDYILKAQDAVTYCPTPNCVSVVLRNGQYDPSCVKPWHHHRRVAEEVQTVPSPRTTRDKATLEYTHHTRGPALVATAVPMAYVRLVGIVGLVSPHRLCHHGHTLLE